ncbi:hypothetical protein JD969_02235 [Planctomycetota bacterium]|nr:hypothetical protein JD969_02235 [Planctomycetota bacterium]
MLSMQSAPLLIDKSVGELIELGMIPLRPVLQLFMSPVGMLACVVLVVFIIALVFRVKIKDFF